MEIRKVKPTLSISLEPRLYKRLKEEIPDRKVSSFVEKAIAEKLGEYDRDLEQKQKEFQQKLIADYRRDARSKALRKEDEIWDEVVGEGIN